MVREYGNWFEDISKDSSEVLSITIFLENFIDNKNLNIKNIKKKLLTFFQVLNGRLKQQNNQIIVSFFSNNDESSITLAKNSSLKDKISVWFKDYSYSLIKKHNNLFYIDLIKEFSNIGISKCIDFRNWYYAHTYLSSEAIKILSNSIEKICSRILGTLKSTCP